MYHLFCSLLLSFLLAPGSVVADKGTHTKETVAPNAHQNEEERDDKESNGPESLGFKGCFCDNPVDGDDQAGHTLPSHDSLGILSREHPR